MENSTPGGSKKEDVYAATTDKTGFAGLLETILRKFRMATFIIAMVPLYLICVLAMGISATPGIYLFYFLKESTENWPQLIHYGSLGVGIMTGYLLYGVSIIFVVPFFNFILPFRVKPFRGGYFSLASVPWYIHNALTYAVRYSFLEYLTPSPLNMMFYRLMGMKIGKGSHINTTNISDPCLIEIGEKVTIGGSATIIAHYATQGYLIVAPVKIQDRVTIGLKATIMGDVVIGEGSGIGPHEVVFPKSIVPPGRKYQPPDQGFMKKE